MATSDTKSLTPQQTECVKALAMGMTRDESARRCGCNRRTVFKWLQKPEFAAAVLEARAEYWDALLAGLRTYAMHSARYLAGVVSGQMDGNALRVKAAQALLNASFRLTQWAEVEDLKRRLDELEGRHEPISSQ